MKYTHFIAPGLDFCHVRSRRAINQTLVNQSKIIVSTSVADVPDEDDRLSVRTTVQKPGATLISACLSRMSELQIYKGTYDQREARDKFSGSFSNTEFKSERIRHEKWTAPLLR